MESPHNTSFSIPTDTDSQYKTGSGIQVQSPMPLSYIKDEKAGSNEHVPALLSEKNGRASHDSYVAVGGRATPVRKYSEEWWKRSWDGAIEHRFWPRVVYAGVFMLVIGAWIGGMIGFAVDEQDWGSKQVNQLEARVQRQQTTSNGNEVSQFYGGIGLKGALKLFDPVARSLTVEWSGYYKDTQDNKTKPLVSDGSRFPINIYRDVSTALHNFGNSSAPDFPPNATDFGTQTYIVSESLEFESQYVLRTDNVTTGHIGIIGTHVWDSIETEIGFGPRDENPSAFKQPLFGYPFDEWSANIVFVATYEWYESEFNVSGLGVYPLYSAYLTENTLNWRFDLSYNPVCALNDFYTNLTSTDGPMYSLPRDNSLPLGLVAGTEGAFPCQLEVTIYGKRPRLVKFAAVMAVIVNWTSTFFIFVLTCETIIMRRGYMLSGTDLLGLNFTALFALPSVRMLLPGAPDFGILIDLVGIIPNVIIISLCITAIAITKLNRHQKPGEKEHDD